MDDATKKQYEEFRTTVDFSKYTNQPYVRRVEKPWGYEIHFTPDTLPYMGKIEHVDEGKRMSLQSHDTKQESWYLLSGEMLLLIEDENGKMQEIKIQPGVGYTCALGQRHRLMGGKGGGEVIEVSTPEMGKTYRLEDDYNRSTETPEEREQRNKEATK